MPTSQYLALIEEYRKLALYSDLVYDPTIYCALTNGSESSTVSGMRSGDARYLAVLGGYEGNQNLTVQYGPEITGVTRDGAPLSIQKQSGLGEVSLQVSAGKAVVLACTVNAAKLPRVVDMRQTKANSSVGVNYYANGLNGTVLAATSGLAWPACYCMYDLGAMPRQGVRVAKYNGWSQNKGTTGVQLLQSIDNRRYTVISQNTFNRGIRMTGRYLRASVSWTGTANHEYGWLSDLTVYTWPSK